MTRKIKSLALATTVASLMAAASAEAQNTLHAPSDLVLTFQNPGGTTGASQTVTIALGNVATVFRDAASGSFTLLNTANISGLGATLLTNFGASWWEQTTLYMGAVNYRGISDTSTTLLGGDPTQTLYFTKMRSGVGTVGQAGSVTPTTIANSGNGITSAMEQVKGRIEGSTTNTAVFVEPVGTSFIDNQNPFVGGNPAFGQATAYTNIEGGVQGQFQSGSFGLLGAAGAVEMALDLYRLQNFNDRAGQYGFGEANRVGEYLGTVTINQSGEVGFLANSVVPEPSTAALLGVAMLGLLARRRNRHA